MKTRDRFPKGRDARSNSSYDDACFFGNRIVLRQSLINQLRPVLSSRRNSLCILQEDLICALFVKNRLCICRGWLVGWLLNVPATCQCTSRTDLLTCTCCHTEIEVADPTFHLTQSQYTDTGPTSPSTDPITPGAWQGSHWSTILKSLV